MTETNVRVGCPQCGSVDSLLEVYENGGVGRFEAYEDEDFDMTHDIDPGLDEEDPEDLDHIECRACGATNLDRDELIKP